MVITVSVLVAVSTSVSIFTNSLLARSYDACAADAAAAAVAASLADAAAAAEAAPTAACTRAAESPVSSLPLPLLLATPPLPPWAC